QRGGFDSFDALLLNAAGTGEMGERVPGFSDAADGKAAVRSRPTSSAPGTAVLRSRNADRWSAVSQAAGLRGVSRLGSRRYSRPGGLRYELQPNSRRRGQSSVGLKTPAGVMMPVINSAGVTSNPGLRAVLPGFAIRTYNNFDDCPLSDGRVREESVF